MKTKITYNKYTQTYTNTLLGLVFIIFVQLFCLLNNKKKNLAQIRTNLPAYSMFDGCAYMASFLSIFFKYNIIYIIVIILMVILSVFFCNVYANVLVSKTKHSSTIHVGNSACSIIRFKLISLKLEPFREVN